MINQVLTSFGEFLPINVLKKLEQKYIFEKRSVELYKNNKPKLFQVAYFEVRTESTF